MFTLRQRITNPTAKTATTTTNPANNAETSQLRLANPFSRLVVAVGFVPSVGVSAGVVDPTVDVGDDVTLFDVIVTVFVLLHPLSSPKKV